LEYLRRHEMSRINAGFKAGGHFEVECLKPLNPAMAREIRLKYGSQSPEYKALPRFKAWEEHFENVVTDEGLDHILDVVLHGATQITTWYVGIFESDTTPDGDTTYATPVFTESSAYDEAARVEYEEAASSSQSVTNSANKATFTISDTKTIYGAALFGGGTNATAIGDTTSGGTILCAGQFSSSRAVVDDDVINVTYTIGAADDGA